MFWLADKDVTGMSGENALPPSTPRGLELSPMVTGLHQSSSPSPPRSRHPSNHQQVSPWRNDVQGDLDIITLATPPSTPAPTAAEGRISRQSGFVAASSLLHHQGNGSRSGDTGIKWNKQHEAMISGAVYRLFIKPLDEGKPQTEGNYVVGYTGKTFLYVVAEPGGGFNIAKFKSHLAREGWGAFSPPARDKYNRDGTMKPSESFGSILSTYYGLDFQDFMKCGKPDLIDITQLYNLGEVIWKLYSCGILDHKCENMNNFRMQYQAVTLPGGARKSLSFPNSTPPTARVSAEGVRGNGLDPEGILISSEDEDDVDQVGRQETLRKEDDRVRAREEMTALEVTEEDVAKETDDRERILAKNKRLKIKVDKMKNITGRALGSADHFKGRIEKYDIKRGKNQNKIISKCVEACIETKMESLTNMVDQMKDEIMSIKKETGGVSAKSTKILNNTGQILTPSYPPPTIRNQNQHFVQHPQQVSNSQFFQNLRFQVPPPVKQQPAYLPVQQGGYQVNRGQQFQQQLPFMGGQRANTNVVWQQDGYQHQVPQGHPPGGFAPQGLFPQGPSAQSLVPQGLTPQGSAPFGHTPRGLTTQGAAHHFFNHQGPAVHDPDVQIVTFQGPAVQGPTIQGHTAQGPAYQLPVPPVFSPPRPAQPCVSGVQANHDLGQGGE